MLQLHVAKQSSATTNTSHVRISLRQTVGMAIRSEFTKLPTPWCPSHSLGSGHGAPCKKLPLT